MPVKATGPSTIWSLLLPFELIWREQVTGINILTNIVLRPAPRGLQWSCCYDDLKLPQVLVEEQTICDVTTVKPAF